MSDITIEEAIAGAEPVDLAALDRAARLLVRRDRKYIVPLETAVSLVTSLAPGARVLTIDGRQTFRYESTYFDTPDLHSFLTTARRRTRRYKVRTRAYIDTRQCVLELKVRDGRGRTVKQRVAYPFSMRDRLDETARSFVSACPLVNGDAPRLRPMLRTRYRRSTLVVGNARVTIDRELDSSTLDGRRLCLAGMAVIETKSTGPPSIADHVLWSMGHRPIRVSKFCTSLALLSPELPSNRWTRALARPWLVGGGEVQG